MLLATACIPKSDLVDLVMSITPLTVTVDADRGRIVTLGCSAVDLVPGAGLRLRGDGHLSWDFAHLPIPVTIRTWQILFVPQVASRGRSHVLRLEPRLEDLEVKLIPGFVDERIADAIRGGLARQRDRLAWDFARTLSKRLPLPANITPATTFEILPVGGDVAVSESELRLALRFEARFERRSVAAEAVSKQPAPPH
jgi:hypothetical protein